MLTNRGYLIGDDFAQRLKDTVKRVEGMPYGDGPTRLETRFEEVPLPPTNFRIGTFGTAAWNIDSSNTVTLTNVGVTGYTVLATNVFGSLPAGGATQNCAVAKDGTAWYLIQPGPPSVKYCKTASAWSKGTSATLSVWVGTPGSETISGETVLAHNSYAAIGSGKFCSVAWHAHGYWYVIAAECS